MTYEQLMEKIKGVSRFGSKLGLERMAKLMDLLGNPQDNIKTIHVAGTNGKGSVSRYLYSVLREGGYSVGLYSSPYLERFSERIECNGQEISKEDLILAGEEVFKQVDYMVDQGYESPTEFEIVTAIGFCYFQNSKVDFVVLEVGLGGRGDSTNIIKNPIASVITSISYDHMEQLGDTLEKIASEKAGIIKKGVPVISNVKDEGAAEVIRNRAEKYECQYFGYPLAQVEPVNHDLLTSTFHVAFHFNDGNDGYDKKYDNMTISMMGLHQVENAVCALAVIEVLRKGNNIDIEDSAVYQGMKNALQKGRMEILKENPYYIVDGAHNEAGAEVLKNTIKEQFPEAKILMVVGVLGDKAVESMLDHFCDITDEFIATEPDNPRKLSAENLCRKILKRGKNCIAISRTEEVCWYFETFKKDYDVVLIAGSLYLIGAVRGILKDEKE